VYRKLDLLSHASLVSERDMVVPSGGRLTKYTRNFRKIEISLDDEGTFSVVVNQPAQERERGKSVSDRR